MFDNYLALLVTLETMLCQLNSLAALSLSFLVCQCGWGLSVRSVTGIDSVTGIASVPRNSDTPNF